MHSSAQRGIDGSLTKSDPSFRLTQVLDAETERFEAELLGGPGAPELTLYQSHLYLKKTAQEYWLFQARDTAGRPAAQAAVYVERSRLPGRFAQGVVLRMSPAANGEWDRRSIAALKQLCTERTDLMTLRLQPARVNTEDLTTLEAHAKSEGFHVVPPLAVTRTLLLDLRPSPEEFLEGLRSKTRSAFKHRSREQVTLRSIAESTFVEPCRRAEEAAFVRTGSKAAGFDFETHFRLARDNPDRAFALGLFLNSRPQEVLAFATAVRHGNLAEYTAAGSFSDPELRSVPFNYFLLWELILWARQHGADTLDLGGVSPGGDGDPLEGISRFKRYLCDREVEIGREMLSVLRPVRHGVFRAIHGVLAKVRR